MNEVEQLATLRAAIADIQGRIAEIDGQPFSRSEAEGLLRDHAAELATEGARTFGVVVQSMEAPKDLGSLLRFQIHNNILDLGPLLAVLLGPKAMGTALARLAAGLPEGLGGAERRDALSTMRADLLKAELDEESLIRHMLRSGYAIERRTDADVRALLAIEE